VLDGRPRELVTWARHWYAQHGRPWVYARQTGGLELTSGGLRLEGAEFSGGRLHEQLVNAQAHDALLVAVSAGLECEAKARELWQEGKPDEYFFLEMYGAAVVEHLVTTTGGRICAWAEQKGMMVLPHYSPGYPGWDVSEQSRLWSLIRQKPGRDFPGEIQVLDSGMLRPTKSLLAVFGITRHLDKVRNFSQLVPCENCSLPSCQYRRTPYHRSLPQAEPVRRLHGGQPGASEAETGRAPVLNHHARYSLNLRALQKWSQERLQLNVRPDRSVAAWFRYEGTTCSNLGRPLSYEYRIQLGPAEEGYRILEARCAPAPGDTGYTFMCEYLNHAGVFLSTVENEKPLLGRPLNDVLTWERRYSPSGCYCDADSRRHKWGLVFEVIHYALVHYEKATTQHRPDTAVLEYHPNQHDQTL
jgi:hypothetical protein